MVAYNQMGKHSIKKDKNRGTVIGALIGIAFSSQPDASTVHKETWMLIGFLALPYLPENI